jgi:hypothetical protein
MKKLKTLYKRLGLDKYGIYFLPLATILILWVLQMFLPPIFIFVACISILLATVIFLLWEVFKK